MQGIYEIYSIKTGKRYIGSSKDIDKRWESHLRGLYNGNHHNYYLQQDYHRYGEDNLVFSVLEEVIDGKRLYEREEVYIKKFKFSRLFNSLRKPGQVPKKKSRWMQYREQDQKKQQKSEYVWGE